MAYNEENKDCGDVVKVCEYRRPEDGSIKVCGLFDPDLHVRKLVSLPGLWAKDRGMELMSHYGFG